MKQRYTGKVLFLTLMLALLLSNGFAQQVAKLGVVNSQLVLI